MSRPKGKKTKSVIENRSFSMCKFRGGRRSRPLQNTVSFVEIAVAPISGHTSSPHSKHVANDEKMSKWSTCSFLSSFLSFHSCKKKKPFMEIKCNEFFKDWN